MKIRQCRRENVRGFLTRLSPVTREELSLGLVAELPRNGSSRDPARVVSERFFPMTALARGHERLPNVWDFGSYRKSP